MNPGWGSLFDGNVTESAGVRVLIVGERAGAFNGLHPGLIARRESPRMPVVVGIVS